MIEIQTPTPGYRWYHAMDLPGVGRVGKIDGDIWDFRAPGCADAYLGGVDFTGRRVLEVGPASGFWTIEMARRGASVLALEIAPEHEWDVVPGLTVDADRAEGMAMVKRGWHLAVEAWRTVHPIDAEIVYGHAEHPPADRGRFDVLTLGAVLLHCRRPFDVLERCSALVDEAVVIAELHFPELGHEPVQRLVPSVENGYWHTWSHFSPAWFERVLPLLGFTDVAVSYHEQRLGRRMVPMYTVVGRR